MKFNWKSIMLLAIILLGAYLRPSHLETSVFGADMARDLEIAQRTESGAELRLVGSTAGIEKNAILDSYDIKRFGRLEVIKL